MNIDFGRIDSANDAVIDEIPGNVWLRVGVPGQANTRGLGESVPGQEQKKRAGEKF